MVYFGIHVNGIAIYAEIYFQDTGICCSVRTNAAIFASVNININHLTIIQE